METIDIGLNDLETFDFNFDDKPPASSNFGAGIELLMNEKKINNNANSIGLGDLDKMEDELRTYDMDMPTYKLDDTSSRPNAHGEKVIGGGFAENVMNMFGFGKNNQESANVPVDTADDMNDSRLGEASKHTMSGHAKTWDGFTKVNEIPKGFNNTTSLNERQLRRRKREMLSKLNTWHNKGLTQSTFDMNSPYEDIEDEYESILEEKRKQEGVKLYGWWFMTIVNSIEYGNSALNPFDLNLDGWADTVSEDMENYEPIFEELYEKYKGGKLAPELQLLFRLGFSAAMANFVNKSLSTATPSVSDAIRHSPQLMRQFTEGVANAMSETNPVMGYLNGMMGGSAEQVNTSFGMPAKPVETRNVPPSNGGSQRPDIAMARGAMFREEGLPINGFSSVDKNNGQNAPVQQQQRREMRGPSTAVDSFLSNLKPRNVDIHDGIKIEDVEGDSIMSRTSMQNFDGNMPKRTNRRRNTSGKTVSMDL